jgi:hypothetical protein
MFPCPFSIRVNAAPKHAHPGSKKLGKQRSGKYALCATYCNKGEARFFKLCKKARTLPNQIGVLAKSNLKRSRYLALEVQLSANKSQKHAM